MFHNVILTKYMYKTKLSCVNRKIYAMITDFFDDVTDYLYEFILTF